MKMGMMGGAFKRGGKDDEKGPKEDKKKDDKKGGPPKGGPPGKGGQTQPAHQKTGNKQDASRARQTKPRIQVTSPDASSIRPAIVSEPRRVLPHGISRMASITDQVIDRKQQRLRLHPVLPQGSRRASLPALVADPFLSSNDWRGAHEKDPALYAEKAQRYHIGGGALMLSKKTNSLEIRWNVYFQIMKMRKN